MAAGNWSIVRLFLSLVLGLHPLLTAGAEPNKATVHVCDLARNLGAYDGRIAARLLVHAKVRPAGAPLKNKCEHCGPLSSLS
jgi:hypothetical protein